MIREIVKAVPSCPRTIAFVLVMEKMSNATDVFFFAATRVGPRVVRLSVKGAENNSQNPNIST